MRLHPVRNYRQPNFPTKQFFEEHPEMLKLIPERWKKNAVITMTLSLVLSLSAHQKAVYGADLSWWMGGDTYMGIINMDNRLVEENFLSELDQSAISIIEDEFRRANLKFSNNVTVDCNFPPFDSHPLSSLKVYSQWPSEKHFCNNRKISFIEELDGYDSMRSIGYEYVSAQDAWDQDYGYEFFSHYQNTLKHSDLLGHIGLFYRSTSEEELRIQVRSFIEWLRVEGVI